MMKREYRLMIMKKTNTAISLTTVNSPNLTINFLPESQSNPDRKRHYIKQIIVSSADESTTHGIDHIFKRKHPFIRLVWTVCFIVSAAICIFMITSTLMSYFSYETVTKAQKIKEQIAEFPAVSICNLSPYLTNQSWEFVASVLVNNGLISSLGSPIDSLKLMMNGNYEVLRYFAGFNSLGPNITNDIRRSFGYELNETLLSCSYNIEECTADDFEWYYDILYGNCYKFNSGKYRNGSKAPIRKSSKAGSINGLTLELFLYEPLSPLSLSTENGVHVLVHNKSDFPPLFDGISVASGTRANIQIERVFSYNLEKPYSACIKHIDENYPSDFVKAMLQSGYKYTQQNCFLACYQDFSFKKCGCYDMYSQILTGVPPLNDTNAVFCMNFSQVICDSQNFMEFFSNDIHPLCESRCPLECESIKYNMYSSESDFPSKAYANLLMQNSLIRSKYASNLSDLTYDSLKRNLVQISVYYSDLGYQKFEELEKTRVGDLISSIGGTLGLFLGMSFLSFVEIIDILLQICFYRKKSS